MPKWQEGWRWTAGMLCLVGLFKEFKPSEPFIVDYAVDFRNFTSDQMVHEILPVTTYGYFVCLFFILLVTDFLRYKPIIVLGVLSSVVCWVITIWFYSTEFQAKTRQIVESITLSTEIAYFTYMYANVDKSFYRRVTSYSHSALHLGRFLGGITGQIALSSGSLEISQLNYLTLGGVILASIVSIFLPQVKRSIYFHPRLSVISNINGDYGGFALRDNEEVGATQPSMLTTASSNSFSQNANVRKLSVRIANVGLKKRLIRAYRALVRDFKIAYTNRYVLKWSLWWSIAQAIYLQVGIYAEPLWKEIEEETHESIYNGVIDASHAFLSAVLAIGMVFVKFPWNKWGEIYLSLISLFQGVILFTMALTHHLYVAYGCYIIFQTLFQVVIIIATTEVAESIKDDSEAFIFGLNTLLALIIQTILTYAVTSESGFDLGIRDEFVVYAIYSCLLGLLFLLIALQRRSRHWEIERSTPTVTQSEQSGNTAGISIVSNTDKAKVASTSKLEETGVPKSEDGNVPHEICSIAVMHEQESTLPMRST